jgi:hypothetical protein
LLYRQVPSRAAVHAAGVPAVKQHEEETHWPFTEHGAPAALRHVPTPLQACGDVQIGASSCP